MVEVEKAERAAAGEKEPALLCEPCVEKVPLEWRAGVRVFPAHERRGANAPIGGGGVPA